MSVFDPETVIDFLAHVVASYQASAMKAAARDQQFDIATVFDGFIPLVEGAYANSLNGDTMLADSPDDTPVWPMDLAIASPQGDDVPDHIAFSRVQTVTASQMRGKLSRVFPKMVLVSQAKVVAKTGQTITKRLPFGLLKSGAIFCGDLQALEGKVVDRHMADLLTAAHGIAVDRHYSWSVLIGENVGPRLRVLTDPTGMREAFALRDIPEGRQRRAALRHWVRQHWRKNRVDSGALAFVRKHLRGAMDFGWEGLRCAVDISHHDRLLEQQLIAERA